MGMINAFKKMFLRDVNDFYADYRASQAHSNAYEQTGREIKKAKKSGKRINASQQYKKNKKKYLAKVHKNKQRWEQFINDL